MEIIVSHTQTDFDGLAAMIGAKRIYPGAEMVFPGTLAKNVQAFMALYKDTIDIRKAGDIDQAAVSRLILVDTANPDRIGPLKGLADSPSVSVHVYDHHPDSGSGRPFEIKVVEPVGATATILTEIIRTRRLPLGPMEATILALGIYEDTGSLLHSSTTPRDLEAAAYLLRAGANLDVISQFTGRPLSDEQKNLYHDLLDTSRTTFINRVKVVMATASIPDYVSGLDLIAHRIGEIEGYDLLLAVVRMSDRVFILARSRIDSVHVNDLVAQFGGGGHEKAASAVVKGGELPEIVAELEAALKKVIRPRFIAADIMSHPVHTVAPETTVAEAGQMLIRLGHTGLPVVDSSRLVGIISRRDVDKARNHGLGHAPVKGYMSRHLVTCTPQTSLPRIQQLMIEYDIGRLPVVEGGQVVGIVSRTDVLRAMHGGPDRAELREGGSPFNLPNTDSPRLTGLIDSLLPSEVRGVLGTAGGLGDQMGMRVYCVGGFVRDLLIGLPNLDVDLVVEGDGLQYAEQLARLREGDLRIHRRFGTAVVSLPEMKIDVASARAEYYPHPAALPEVQPATIRQDLYRRDFSVNAMALSLNHDRFGELVDYYHGYRDLQEKLIRVLHSLSFVDDPTRIFRAVRFEHRYGFRMDDETEGLAKRTAADGFINTVSGKRLREELIAILEEPDPIASLRRLDGMGVFPMLFADVKLAGTTLSLLDRTQAGWERWAPLFSGRPRRWLVYFLGLVHTLEDERREETGRRFQLDRYALGALAQVGYGFREVIPAIRAYPSMKNSELWRLIGGLVPEVLIAVGLGLNSGDLESVLMRAIKLSQTRLHEISGSDLLSMGLTPGPLFQEVLDRIRDARLDGEVVSRQEEIDLVARLMRSSGEGR